MQSLLRGTTAYQLLAHEAQTGRLANTYLLLFNDSVNLRAALKEFACLFFDGSARTRERIQRESHPDCLFSPAEGKALDKDAAAAIVEESNLRPVEGDRKLFVLDNMQKASAFVQNKLLKSLEEPPRGVCFLLGATSEFSLLATVKSRAKRLEIPPFSEEQVEACLRRMYPDRTDAAMYAAASDGVVGRAQSLMNGNRYAELTKAAFACVSARRSEIASVTRALNGVTEKNELISLMRRMYRDMLFYRTGQTWAVGANEPNAGKVKTLSEEFTPATLLFALETFAEAEKQLTFNANLSQCVEVGLWKIEKEKQKCKK